MSRAWACREKFLIDRRAQVQIGPQEFPPPSEDEVQGLIDQLEDSVNLVDQVLGYDATLTARYGQELVDYLNQISDGLHYVLLQGRRPGPPPGFAAESPAVEIEPGTGFELEDEDEELDLGFAEPGGELPLGAAQKAQAVDAVARLDEAVTDIERLLGERGRLLARALDEQGADASDVHRMDEAADIAREALAALRRRLSIESE